MTFNGKINHISTDQCEEALRIISDIEFVLTSACGSSSIVYGHESIARNDESSRVCAALVRGDRNLSVKLGLEEQIPEDTPDRSYGRFVDAIVLDEWAVIAVASATFIFDKSEEQKSIISEDFSIEDLELIETINLADRIKIIQSDQNVGVCMARILTEESEDPSTEA